MSDRTAALIVSKQLSRAMHENPQSTSKGWLDIDLKTIRENLFLALQKKSVIIIATSLTAAAVSGYLFNRVTQKSLLAVNSGLRFPPGRGSKRISTSGSNKNVPDGVLVLHQCPRGRRTPCIAPYPLKLETFLRIHTIKYEVDFNCLEDGTTDAPWLTLDLEDICDSQNCMKFLIERYQITEPDIDEATKANVRAYTHLLEHHLYWGIALWRWVYDGARSLSEIQFLPNRTLKMIPKVCRTVERSAWFHGIGKKSPRDVTQEILADLAALSNFLGSKPYFVNPKPCDFDCTAFAMLSQMIYNMDGSPFTYELKTNEKLKNLVEFCFRMKKCYWPDWAECLNDEPYDD